MDKLFPALCVLWFASELWIGRRRSGDPSRSKDAGTLRLLLLVVYASIALAAWLASTRVARFPANALAPTLAIGMAAMVAGMALRWWAIRVLSRWFTVDVAIRPDQPLVRSGPYRRLRHPSYTGSLLTFYGFALCLGNWPSLAAVAIPVTLAFLWRIRIEERVLAAAFPVEYPAYARETWRLIPWLW